MATGLWALPSVPVHDYRLALVDRFLQRKHRQRVVGICCVPAIASLDARQGRVAYVLHHVLLLRHPSTCTSPLLALERTAQRKHRQSVAGIRSQTLIPATPPADHFQPASVWIALRHAASADSLGLCSERKQLELFSRYCHIVNEAFRLTQRSADTTIEFEFAGLPR